MVIFYARSNTNGDLMIEADTHREETYLGAKKLTGSVIKLEENLYKSSFLLLPPLNA